ncbi:MAG: dihydropteroate synthase [Betaproteobacteria bacterium]|nr:dihydropteroate synthase [Betaproteobacteria bacterium]
MNLHCRDKILDLCVPRIMGIVNVTPDSFSDGGNLPDARAAIAHALRLLDEGAEVIDIGGESTRPGAQPVSVDEELSRVVPVIEALRGCSAVLSVDTRHLGVMRAAIEAGADMINDVEALAAPGALELAANTGVAVCLMHMQGQPDSMQQHPVYGDVVDEVEQFLRSKVALAEQAGIASESIVIDPGFGFGKSLTHNLQLLRHLGRLKQIGKPLLAGMSRKSMLGQVTGRPVAEREYAGLAAHLYALRQGASLFRVHDVAAMRDAILVWQAIGESE